ncbi:FUN14 domain-containing protein 2 [Bombina bombina]|uniref:FUN14 domain-containing protein 2 n=1 Tax=Bombina bombina TaxID=8345 RepID=UPI00235AF71D|nr:FUN14 domain-containing protein 2 [Bombina bombina]
MAASASDGSSLPSLDLGNLKNKRWWNKIFGQNSGPGSEKYSVLTQILVGGAAGWCAGFLCIKVGKLAASAAGGGFLILQIAHHTGYIHVNWKRLEKDMNKAKEQLKIQSKRKSRAQEIQIFLKRNAAAAGGFAGGFLIGMAS